MVVAGRALPSRYRPFGVAEPTRYSVRFAFIARAAEGLKPLWEAVADQPAVERIAACGAVASSTEHLTPMRGTVTGDVIAISCLCRDPQQAHAQP